MIVRINQLDLRRADGVAGWEPNDGDPRAPVRCPWPSDTQAVQVLVLELDEQQQMMGLNFRRRQIRKLIGDVCVSLGGDDQLFVVRLDGPVFENELLPAFKFVADADAGRFAVSGFQRLDDETSAPFTGVRLALQIDRLRQLISNPNLGLDRETRVRVYVVPPDWIDPLLDIADVDDERWPELLETADFILSTARGGESLIVHTRKFSPAEVKAKLTNQLIGEASSRPEQ